VTLSSGVADANRKLIVYTTSNCVCVCVCVCVCETEYRVRLMFTELLMQGEGKLYIRMIFEKANDCVCVCKREFLNVSYLHSE